MSSSLLIIQASESKMVVNLHVNDGCSSEGIKIPISKLLLESGSSYATLRRTALNALFKYSESGEVPEYAKESFETQFTYKRNGKEFQMNRNEEITNALEIACTENYSVAEGDVILDIYCTFVNTYKNEGTFGKIASMFEKTMKAIHLY